MSRAAAGWPKLAWAVAVVVGLVAGRRRLHLAVGACHSMAQGLAEVGP